MGETGGGERETNSRASHGDLKLEWTARRQYTGGKQRERLAAASLQTP